MGYVIGFIALFLIVFAFTDPAKGVPLLILVVGGVIAFFRWMSYLDSDEYKNKKNEEKVQKQRVVIQNKMNLRFQEIDNIANGQLFKQLRSYIWDLNKRMYERVADRECAHNNKPQARPDMLAFPRIKIEKTRIYDGGYTESVISLDEWGYNDLTDDEVQLLGMALIKYGKYKLYNENQEDFSYLSVDWDYWKPYVEKYIEAVFTERKNEYDRTHRSIY